MRINVEAFGRLMSWADRNVTTIGVTVIAMAVAATGVGIACTDRGFGNDSSCHHKNGNLKQKRIKNGY